MPKGVAPQCLFFHRPKEHRQQNQDMNCRGNHTPTIGAAIGFITSEPIPLSNRIGMRLASTAVTVISFARSRYTAPSDRRLHGFYWLLIGYLIFRSTPYLDFWAC